LLVLDELRQNLLQLLNRIGSYSPFVMVIELLIIGSVVHLTLQHLRGTRGANVIKGALLVLIPGTLIIQFVGGGIFERLNTLYSNVLEVLTIGLIIVFQPELRRALTRLGEFRAPWAAAPQRAKLIDELMASMDYLSRNKIGALMAFERTESLRGLVDSSGTRLDAVVSSRLINTIFWPGSALHDLGVVIRGDRVVAAGVQFPLAEGDQLSAELGSRHRAALGLTLESDVLVVVISEETGVISVAEKGLLSRHLSLEDLRQRLTQGFGQIELSAENETNGGGR
jgi:diadenylate cyclase